MEDLIFLLFMQNSIIGGIAVDKAGNVYITGSSNDDYVTVKYSSQGAEQWLARYNSPDNGHDWASGIVIDGNSNIYVTGGSQSGYATIKYDASGNEQWIALYTGRGWGASLALDNTGNLCVMGWNVGMITTIKYTQSGTPVVGAEPKARPDEFSLAQNYPNPLNPTATIAFALPKASFVTLKIYDLLGHEVATLVSEKLQAGKHQRVWEAKDLASGVYLYRLQAGNFVAVKKLILMH